MLCGATIKQTAKRKGQTMNNEIEVDEFEILRRAQAARGEAYAYVFRAVFGRIGSWIRSGVIEPLRRNNRYNSEYRELMGMGDALYRDLGISRGQIAYTMRHGRDIQARKPANLNDTGGKTEAA
jgi:uncharacterized protein YjiS (DUF1127 family)